MENLKKLTKTIALLLLLAGFGAQNLLVAGASQSKGFSEHAGEAKKGETSLFKEELAFKRELFSAVAHGKSEKLEKLFSNEEITIDLNRGMLREEALYLGGCLHGSIKCGFYNPITLLFVAVCNDDLKSVKVLLNQKGIDPNKECKFYYEDDCWLPCYGTGTPLFVAAKKGYVGIVKSLLGHKDIDPNKKVGTKRGIKTPLLVAVEKRDVEIVKSLLGHKDIDPNKKVGTERENNIKTPLLVAVERNYKKMISALLKHRNIDTTGVLGVGWERDKN